MKNDWKPAYWHTHYNPKATVQSIITIGSFILMTLHITFGAAANPSQWSNISEVATDLSNNLVHDEGWDANEFSLPHQHFIGDSIQLVLDEVPFAPTAELVMQLPNDDCPKADCYMDDIFSNFWNRMPLQQPDSSRLYYICYQDQSRTLNPSHKMTSYQYPSSWPKLPQNDS